MRKLFIHSLFFLLPFGTYAQKVTVTVTNPTSVQRQEVVEIPYTDACQKMGIKEGDLFTVKNSIGQEVDYQVTYDKKVLIDASVQPNGTAEFTLEKGVPEKALHFNTLPNSHSSIFTLHSSLKSSDSLCRLL